MSPSLRADLLALTPDDLASLSNRGMVKRAQKELESGEMRFTIHDTDGNLRIEWSDGVCCVFPAGKSLHDAVCSSGTLGISRHIIRSVLAYQATINRRFDARMTPSGSEIDLPSDRVAEVVVKPSDTSSTTGVWDPGTISDEDLCAHFRKPAIAQARKRFGEGLLVELIRGSKPVAHFLDHGCTVRFMVPGDLRYVSADCADSLLPTWVPLAVWAFRELPKDRLSGIVSRSTTEWHTPQKTLSELDSLIEELFRDGLEGISDAWQQRWTRMESSLRTEGLIWPAELVTDLLQQCEMYKQHDARFEPRQVVQLLGELTARTRAIQNQPASVPQPLIRGTQADRAHEISGGRMIGVGLGVRRGKKHTTISAFLQDADSGNLAAFERTFSDPDPQSGEQPRSFADLAGTILVRGVSLANLAMSQLLLKSGKRTPGGQLILPRMASNLVTHPQNFQWEHLKPPFAVESFTQLSGRLDSLPPSCLRPRRCTENLHVISVLGAEGACFDIANQELTAQVRDSMGGVAELIHPYHNRDELGFNHLMRILMERGNELRFVSGHFRIRNRRLQIRPVALVLDGPNGRQGILPYVVDLFNKQNREPSASRESFSQDTPGRGQQPSMHLADYLAELEDQLAELAIRGLKSAWPATWEELAKKGQHLGMVRWTQPVSELAQTLASRPNNLNWSRTPAIRMITELCLLCRLANE